MCASATQGNEDEEAGAYEDYLFLTSAQETAKEEVSVVVVRVAHTRSHTYMHTHIHPFVHR
jgi:hypothetical protein